MAIGRRLVLVLALTLGCESSPVDDPDGGPDLEPVCDGDRCAFVIGALRVPREGAPIPGIDLDGRVSDESDAQGCGHPDFVAPDGREGIDNQFVTLAPTLEAALGEDVDDTLREAIGAGELLFVVELVGDPSEPSMEAGPAELAPESAEPALDPTGRLVDGLTLVRTEPAHSAEPSIRAGVVEAPLGDVLLDIPFDDTTNIELLIRDARLRVPFVDGRPTTGTLAGRLYVDDLLATIPDPTGGPIGDTLVRDTLEEQADLDPDGAAVCQSISIAFALDLVPAQLAP
jgi:hypothetical protein